MLLRNLALLLAATSLALASNSPHKHSRSRARNAHPRRAEAEHSLSKRDFSGRATFYDVGLGGCGWSNVGSDYIVALNTAQFGISYPSPQCGKSITISYNGVQVGATIADSCPSCDYGSLDLSRGLFNRFASEDVGQFHMSWWFNDGSGPETTTSTSTFKTPTSAYTPPTSTYTPPTSTSTSTSTYVEPTTTTMTDTTLRPAQQPCLP